MKGFKIGACDWSLGKKADPGVFDVARQIGLDGLQISLGSKANYVLLQDKDVQKTYQELSRRQGIEIASLAIGELNNVPYKSDPRAEQWVWDAVDVCRAMGIKVILLAFFSAGDLRDDPAGIREVIRRLTKVAPKAEKAGVSLGIESWLSAWEVADMIQKVGSPAIKMYYDVGNTHTQGYDIYEEIRFLARQRLCEFHAKDYDNFLLGRGKVNFLAVRAAMDDIGYRGWIHLEAAQPLGLIPSYQENLRYLRGIFPPTVEK